MKSTFTASIDISGLAAYTRVDEVIDALLLASREGASQAHEQSHGLDRHLPLLVFRTLDVRKDSAAPDLVFDAEGEEYAGWYLDGVFVEARPDGLLPSGKVDYTYKNPGGKSIAQKHTAHSLHWLPDMAKASGARRVTVRRDCRLPSPNRNLVAAAVRLSQGKVTAFWSMKEHWTQQWEFELPRRNEPHPPPEHHVEDDRLPELPTYRQALADGVTWSLELQSHLELLLTPLGGGMPRRLIVNSLLDPKGALPPVTGAITNKTATAAGQSVFERSKTMSHFQAFYDLLDPAPGLDVRRVPKSAIAFTKANRCPGASA